MAFYINLRVVQDNIGVDSANATPEDMIKFLGVCIVMECLKCPRTCMYWVAETKVPCIRDVRLRDRLFFFFAHG